MDGRNDAYHLSASSNPHLLREGGMISIECQNIISLGSRIESHTRFCDFRLERSNHCVMAISTARDCPVVESKMDLASMIRSTLLPNCISEMTQWDVQKEGQADDIGSCRWQCFLPWT
jgi:hypothetical protein